jgi:transcriptional regulator with XRE-family HTH domain
MMAGVYGAFLREIRESRGLSQAQLAEVSGIGQPNLSAYERDRRVPTAATLNTIVVACGYQLTAVAGPRTVRCPLPRMGWFPDEDDPPPLPGDPAEEAPTVTVDTPLAIRLQVIDAVLDIASATTGAR